MENTLPITQNCVLALSMDYKGAIESILLQTLDCMNLGMSENADRGGSETTGTVHG